MEQSFNGILNESKDRMVKAVARLEQDLKGIRTGRATPGLVDHIRVDYYGSMTPIAQVAQVSVQDGKTIVLKPFDQTLVPAIEKAILASNVGITPQSDGKMIRLPVPMLTEEQRKKLAHHAKEVAEQQRIAVRNVRRDGNKESQVAHKGGKLTEDQARDLETKITDLTKQHEAKIDELLKKKTEEITKI